MQYLHTMLRCTDLEETLDFFKNKLGLREFKRYDNINGKFTLVFLCAPEDYKNAQNNSAPLIEITYNWPDENGKKEKLKLGRSFGHIAFRVNNIYETCEQLIEKGVKINRPPRDGYMAFIKSPDNISVELLQKGEPLKLKEPWKSMPNKGRW